MKKLMIFVLSCTLLLGLLVSAGAVESDGTYVVLYVRAEQPSIGEVRALLTCGSESLNGVGESMTPEGDGLYSLAIPLHTAEQADQVTISLFSADASDGASLEDFDSFAFPDTLDSLVIDFDQRAWITEGEGETLPPTTPPPDTNPETSPATGSYTDREGENTATIPVSGRVEDASVGLVSVDITWEDMVFTYTIPAPYEEAEPTWSSDSNAITITNYSTVEITASFDFTSEETLDVAGEFRNSENQPVTAVNLAAAEVANGEMVTPTEESVTFHITEGHIDSARDQLGTITVTISKP